MSNEQEPKNIENEPKAEDELANEELDQVVGGSGPIFTPPTLPPTNNLTLSGVKYDTELKLE